MTGEEFKTLIDSYVQALNSHDANRLMDDYTYDCVRIDTLTGKLQGKDAVKGFYITLFTAFSDLHFTADEILGADDTAAVEWTLTGTQQGVFPPFESYGVTGKKVTLSGATFFDFKGGKIAEQRVHTDYGVLLEELGVTPARKAA